MYGNRRRETAYYACSPKKRWRPLGHPCICRVREDTLLNYLSQFLAKHVFGQYRKDLLATDSKMLDDAEQQRREQGVRSVQRAIADNKQQSLRLVRSLEIADDIDRELATTLSPVAASCDTSESNWNAWKTLMWTG